MKRIVSLSVFAISFIAAAVTVFVSPQEKAPANGAAAVFEKSFANGRAVRRATWAVTAQGVFEAFANGRRVGNDFLKPGVTECGKCRHVYSYDVTDLLDRRAGATNVLSATVTPGWWCDQMMRPPDKVSDWQRGNKREWQLGQEIAFRGELRLEFEDGSAQTVGTDESWLAAYTGPVVSAGIYEGEVYDARRQVEGLKGVRRNTEFAGELRPAAAKIALREDLVLTPREMHVVKGVEGASKDAFGVAKVIRRYADGEDVRLEPGEMLVIDFGQNCSAVPSFEVTGEAGAELKIRASEMLNESHGEKSRGNDGPAGTPYLAALRSAYAGIHYTLKDGRQAYMPRYTYFGYRYLGVTTTRPVVFARWRSTPVSSVTREMERGRIVTGNARVNRLIANIRWGLLSNYLSSPTDCPQRDERMGWTADTQVFMNSAAYFADTSEFLDKYLSDLRDAQRASGCYMCFVPNVRHTFPPWASAGWTDAGVIIPYRLWKWYGDRRFVDESWESMARYMDFLEGDAEPYRINHGDWLAFEHHLKAKGDAMDGRQVKALNAYFRVWMAMLMREMAAATGRGAAERHYAEEEAKLRRAFAAAYVGPDGTIKDEYKGQCNDLYMLKLGLCGGAAAVEATKRDLVDNIKACGNRLQTGFLGTAILMPTLTFEANAPELAYSLLLQDAFPSWLYSVDQGATTVWERWNGYTKEKGFGPVGMNSFNHYAYGCVAEWLFAAAAGIRQPKGAVGWKRFVLAPIPDKRLGSVDASFISPEGEIKSSWKYGEDGTWIWTFAVPQGTSARVSAPGIPEREYGPGEWTVTLPPTFEVRQVFREERFTRGNVNLRPLQAADDADWIWIADGGPAKGEMDAVRFSKEFVCGAPELEIDVSADERFVLFLDGREIARGPHKGLVNHWYYQSYAIAGLEPGTHRLEAVVYRMEAMRPRGVLSAGKGGFLLKASGAYDAALTTGKGKWQARRITGTRMEGFGDSQGFGGSGQSVAAGTGFLDPAAATGAPCGVKVVRRRVVDSEYGVPREGWALFPTERPDQMSVRRQPGSFKAGQPLFHAGTNIYYQASDAAFPLVAEMNALLREGKSVTIPVGTSARLVWDMDDYFCAYPILETSGGVGAEIRWGWAESLYDRAHRRADRNAFDGKRCAHAMRDTFRPDGRARAAFTSPWWRCGRWCEFEVKTADAPLTLTKLAFDEVRYPLAARASFDCDDTSIADVWRLCWRGLENCMHETYMDCPYFEQQMYPGDTRVVMLIANALSGDARLTRFGIGHFDYARRDNGLVPMNSPCYLVQDSSTYSMCWVAMLGDYALWNGGKDFLKARLPGMRHTLHLLLNCTSEEGLLENLPGWSFQDWVEGWDFYGNAPDGRLGLSAVNNLLCVYALDSAIRVEEYAGDKMMADYWRARKKALADAVLAKFWDDQRGMVADTAAHDRFSEHAQCLALLSDVLPPDRAARALDGLLTSPDLARTTVYFSHYLFDVYVKYGHADRFLKRLDLWRDYVRTGLRTPLEAPGVRARSDCHAWGSHPIYHLLTGVAGIKPASDGFASVRIAPQPGGLKRISARMPTPKGMVSLALRFEDDAPIGTVTLPEGLPGTFVWKGATHPLHAGENIIR